VTEYLDNERRNDTEALLVVLAEEIRVIREEQAAFRAEMAETIRLIRENVTPVMEMLQQPGGIMKLLMGGK
jgi:hypothetical protein